MENSKTYNARTAARALNVAQATIKRHIDKGTLQAYQRLNQWVIKEADLKRWASDNNLEFNA